MRRPDVRIRVQLICSVSLFTIVCLASLAAAIYTLSQRTLLNLEVGNLDLNCRMKRDESYQVLLQSYQYFSRMAVSSPIRDILGVDGYDSYRAQADLLHDYFGPDRLLMLNIYAPNYTEVLQIDSRAINDTRVPVSLTPLSDPTKDASKVAAIADQTGGYMVGPIGLSEDAMTDDTTSDSTSHKSQRGTSTTTTAFKTTVKHQYFLSFTLPVRGTLAGLSQSVTVGYVTGLFSARKLQQVLSDASFNLAESEIGPAALCIVQDDWKTLTELIPFDASMSWSPTYGVSEEVGNMTTLQSHSIILPAAMANLLKQNIVPDALPNQGPRKSMISIAQFLFLGHVYHVVVLQAHNGVYRMSHNLRTLVLIACFSIGAGVFFLTFFFVSYGVRQILKLKMATNYERPAPGRWRWLPWWLRPRGSVQSVVPLDESEMQVPEKVPLGKHFRDEFDDITLRFNNMSDELRRQYGVLEDRVRARKQEIETARRAANEANAAKSHFLARVTHELRTPLNGIIGTATLCLEEENISQIHQSLRTIFKCGELLLHLMTDLLSFSQYEVENQELEIHEFMISDVTSQLSAIFLEQCKMKGIKLLVQPADAYKNLVFYGDTNRILQVIFNLLSNGLKFTPEKGQVMFHFKVEDPPSSSTDGGRSVFADPPETSPDEFRPEPSSPNGLVRDGIKVVTFIVQDTGPGIAKELQSKVFEAFVQGDISTSVRKAGVGLGLSICQQLAERMNGSIALESELNRGSTFRFTVPLWYTYVGNDSSCGLSSPSGELWPESELYSAVTTAGKSSDTDGHSVQSPLRDIRSPQDSAVSTSRLNISSSENLQKTRTAAPHGSSTATLSTDTKHPISGSETSPLPASPGDGQLDSATTLRSAGGLELGAPGSSIGIPDQNSGSTGFVPAPTSTLMSQAAPTQLSTTFTPSTLPAQPVRPPMQGRSSYAEHPPSHIKVLVVDDNKVNQEVMKRMLNLEGLTNITIANDGFEAIARVEDAIAEDERFDVIFMDVQMPNLDGRSATRVLRKEKDFKAPIVAVSAFANEENANDCVAAGMNLFLSKPLRRPHLRSILKSLSEMRQPPTPISEESSTSPGSSEVDEKHTSSST